MALSILSATVMIAVYFETADDSALQPILKRLRREHGRPKLLCRVCANPITSPEQAIEMSGAHRHDFVNPAGQAFTIGCFGVAGGCVAVGRSWAEHSWFAGYTWRVALCRRCEVHLGWRFDGRERFFGLILAALRGSG